MLKVVKVMNNKEAVKSKYYKDSEGNTYRMYQTGKIEKVTIDEDGDESYEEVGMLEQVVLRKKFKELSE
jgi:hypothetical protein